MPRPGSFLIGLRWNIPYLPDVAAYFSQLHCYIIQVIPSHLGSSPLGKYIEGLEYIRVPRTPLLVNLMFNRILCHPLSYLRQLTLFRRPQAPS